MSVIVSSMNRSNNNTAERDERRNKLYPCVNLVYTIFENLKINNVARLFLLGIYM